MKRYTDCSELYIGPEREITMDSIAFDPFLSDVTQVYASKSKNKTNRKKKEKIRSCFALILKKQNEKEKKKKIALF